MFEKETIAAAAARYSSENILLRAKIEDIEARKDLPMPELTQSWTLPSTEQAKGQIPVQSTLQNTLDTDIELAVCASELFIMIVQNRIDLGGGYGVQVIALDKLITRHIDTLAEVEAYLDENAPYTAHAPVWMPLPAFLSHKHEIELLNKIK